VNEIFWNAFCSTRFVVSKVKLPRTIATTLFLLAHVGCFSADDGKVTREISAQVTEVSNPYIGAFSREKLREHFATKYRISADEFDKFFASSLVDPIGKKPIQFSLEAEFIEEDLTKIPFYYRHTDASNDAQWQEMVTSGKAQEYVQQG